MCGGITAQQRDQLLFCACGPQAVQQPGHVVGVVEGDACGRADGQRGDLLFCACGPQAVQQPGHGERIGEGDVSDGVFTKLAGVTIEAEAMGGITERSLIGG